MSGKVHECLICHKSFPTGQALGGHKRCHYKAPIPTSLAAAAVLTANRVSVSEGMVRSKHPDTPEVLPRFAVSGNVDNEVENPHPSKKPRFLALVKTEAA
ncbi:hypothetical protein ACJRO7_031061 [Eucalyptus globulus]|uniref:C2H2-type domain-containing protein n=1 Tax=Eucalyptus globulus TaxID=34317 RepID=A0ABD3JDK2_EUCGL